MKVYSLMLGSYQTNCYLAADDDGVCAVIDPGYTPERVLEAAQRYGLTIRAVLLTHGHFDHVGGVRGVAEAARCPVWLCEADTALPERLTAGPLYYTDTYADGDTVEVSNEQHTGKVQVKVTQRINPDALYMPSHYGCSSKEEKTAYGVGLRQMDYVPFRIEPGYGGICSQEAVVTVKKVGA